MSERVYFDMVRTPAGGWKDLSVKEWFFWPALCYRIVAPEARQDERNLFERAVIGLARSRIFGVQEQGRLTGLDPRLVEVIQKQLADEGFLLPDGTLTDAGQELARTGISTEDTLVSGWVFQDPFTGLLWDRFVEDPAVAEVEIEGTSRTLVRGRKGNPFRVRAFAESHPIDVKAPPSPEDICRALRRFRKSQDRNRALREEASSSYLLDMQHDWIDDGFDADDGDFEARVRKVTFVDEKPVHCHVALCLYSRSRVPSFSNLFATDPFGQPGASDRLLREILDRAASNRGSPLSRRIDDMFGKSVANTGLEEFRAKMESIRLEAERRVEEAIGFDRGDQLVFDPMVRMEQAILEVELLGEDAPEKRLAAIGSVRDVLEAVLKQVTQSAGYQGLERYVDLGTKKQAPDAKVIRHVFEETAAAIGLKVPLPQHLMGPAKLKSVFSRMKSLSRGSSHPSRMVTRDLVEVCLLSTCGDPDHPLTRAAGVDPAFVERIFRLADVVNPPKHGTEPPAGVTPEGVRSEIYELWRMLMEPGHVTGDDTR